MLSDLYYRKKAGFPFLSAIFLVCCLIVSISTHFDPKLYSVFGNTKTPLYFWQLITPIFEHGQIQGELFHIPGYDPLLLHLFCNFLMLLAFGVLSERVLGAKRFILLSLSALTIDCILRIFFSMGGNGASGVIYAYTPVSLLIILRLYKTAGKELFKDWLLYIFIAGFILGWIAVTAVYASRGNTGANIVHLCATLTGFAFAYVWRKTIYARTDEALLTQSKKRPALSDNIIYAVASVIPVFLVVGLVLALGGFITSYI